jgi:cytochrome c oxidase subunit 1
MASEQHISEHIHLPDPSYYPVMLAFGVVLLAAGVLSTPIISGVGLVIILVAVAGWTQENRLQARKEEHDHGTDS